VAWLKAAIAEAEAAGEAVVVLTHHLPSNNS
jgi:3',5'-cyclic AMP phosphodiesterase CpdA